MHFCAGGLQTFGAPSNSTYQVISGNFTWQQAKEDAERRGGHLATITSQQEFDYVASLGSAFQFTGGFWLGATDAGHEGTWTWVTGEPWGYTAWYDNEPNNLGQEHYLVGGSNIGFRWNDWGQSFNTSPHYILEIEGNTAPIILVQPLDFTAAVGSSPSLSVLAQGPFPLSYQWYFGEALMPAGTNRVLILSHVGTNQAGGYRVVVTNNYGAVTSQVAMLSVVTRNGYQMIAGHFTWQQAKADAEQRGGHLATITSQQEFDYVKSLGLPILFLEGFWLGATDEGQEGTWTWVTGEPWDYTAWNVGEPNNFGPENYLVGGGAQGYLWNDWGRSFHTTPHYLLEIEGNSAPTVVSDPTNATAVVGSSASVAVSVTGSWPLSYQWYFGDTLLPHGTNRILNLSDIRFSQAGDYRVVVTNAFGAVTSKVATLTVVNPPALVRILGGEASVGGNIELPIELVANGDENAIGFSLRFDSNRLTFVSAELGEDATNASLVVNSSTAASGNVGLAIALPAGQAFSAGTQHIARLILTVAPTATVVMTPITFGDDPVKRQLSNANAALLAGTYVDGSVAVLPSTIRVGQVETTSGGSVTVPIALLALGNENGVSFSLGFEPTLLTATGVQPGSGLPPDASLLINTNLVASGRIGISVVLQSGTAFSRGANELVTVGFEVATVLQPVTIPIRFGDNPTIRQVSSPAAQPLPGAYQEGGISVVSVAFEADIAPRPGGDRVLSITDWVQAGRFAAALDSVDAAEYQRVDCAPRATRGNGVISVADWVQTGRYSASLDPITGIGGPVESAVIALAAADGNGNGISGCEVRITNTNVLPGETLTVPVLVTAVGTENALGFSVTFDAAKLRYIGASKQPPASAATLNLNPSQAESGQLGVALALPIGSTYTAGRQAILSLSFEAVPAASGTITIGFGDSPVIREAVSVNANTVPATFAGGVITIGPTAPVGPTLGIAGSGESILLFWDVKEHGFEPQVADEPVGATWSKVSATPIEIGGQKIITLPNSGGHKYFRLQKP